jgi:hypothetical protein
MSDTYFKYFPTILDENNNEVLDLMTHVFPMDIEALKMKSLETVILSDNDYAERVSNVFYQDPHLFYPLFLINDIINPFNEWVIQEEELHRCVVEKYKDNFLHTHQKNVLEQFQRFFHQQFSFELSHTLPMGNYVLRLFYGDRRMSGTIHLSLNYTNKTVDVNKKDILPFMALESNSYQHDFYLGNVPSKMTKKSCPRQLSKIPKLISRR